MDPFAFLAGSQKPEAQKPEARDLPTLQPSRNVSGFPVRDRDVNRGVPVAHRTIANVFGPAREKSRKFASGFGGPRGANVLHAGRQSRERPATLSQMSGCWNFTISHGR